MWGNFPLQQKHWLLRRSVCFQNYKINTILKGSLNVNLNTIFWGYDQKYCGQPANKLLINMKIWTSTLHFTTYTWNVFASLNRRLQQSTVIPVYKQDLRLYGMTSDICHLYGTMLFHSLGRPGPIYGGTPYLHPGLTVQMSCIPGTDFLLLKMHY